MEDRERGHGDVGVLVLDGFAAARIRQRLEHQLQLSDEVSAQRMHLPACNWIEHGYRFST